MNESPRFEFTGQPLESVRPDGRDRPDDYFPNPETYQFCVFKLDDLAAIKFRGQSDPAQYHETDLPWPGAGTRPRHELADKVTKCLNDTDHDPTRAIEENLKEELRQLIAEWRPAVEQGEHRY